MAEEPEPDPDERLTTNLREAIPAWCEGLNGLVRNMEESLTHPAMRDEILHLMYIRDQMEKLALAATVNAAACELRRRQILAERAKQN